MITRICFNKLKSLLKVKNFMKERSNRWKKKMNIQKY